MQRNKIIQILEDGVMNTLIRENVGHLVDPLTFRKQHQGIGEVSEVIKILHLYHKARKKIPDWVTHLTALTPRSLEQASSQQTAAFKAGLLHGDRMLNLTGGLGVDDVAFARTFNQVISVDSDWEVHEIAQYNMLKMSVHNVDRRLLSAEKALEVSEGVFDLVYIDPDRRAGSKDRSLLLEDCSPDVLSMQKDILERSRYLMLKLSPLFDLSEIRRILISLKQIVVLSVHNEVKEVLTIQEAGYQGIPGVRAVDITADGSTIEQSEDEKSPLPEITIDERFLYESGAAVVKAGLIEIQHQNLGLKRIGNSPFHTGGDLSSPFLGKKYRILWHTEVKWDGIRKKLKQLGVERVQVSSRDFYIRPKEILNKLKMPEGGDIQLLFTRDSGQRSVVYCCERSIDL